MRSGDRGADLHGPRAGTAYALSFRLRLTSARQAGAAREGEEAEEEQEAEAEEEDENEDEDEAGAEEEEEREFTPCAPSWVSKDRRARSDAPYRA